MAGGKISPTPVFDSYWRFAAERQAVYMKRLAGEPAPWTDDPVLHQYRFTNCYRAADRVSQYLIRHVIYNHADYTAEDIVFRILLFKVFNSIRTWNIIQDAVGEPSWNPDIMHAIQNALERAVAAHTTLYNPAYVMPPVNFGASSKFANHLQLIEAMMIGGVPQQIEQARNLYDVFYTLLSFSGIGPFLAFQYTIDINYSPIIDFSENSFVVAGPGAISGIRKGFGPISAADNVKVIHYMTDHQDTHFDRLGLKFHRLGDTRPLQLIDCQNLFCEVDKYARIVHPGIHGVGNRTRIKQNYRTCPTPLEAPFFPPKWGINSDWERQECCGEDDAS